MESHQPNHQSLLLTTQSSTTVLSYSIVLLYCTPDGYTIVLGVVVLGVGAEQYVLQA